MGDRTRIEISSIWDLTAGGLLKPPFHVDVVRGVETKEAALLVVDCGENWIEVERDEPGAVRG